MKDVVAYKNDKSKNYTVNTNVDLFNNSDKGRNNSNQQRKGDGRSPTATTGKRFENLFKMSKIQNEKLEKQRAEEKEKAENEFDFKPKLFKSRIKPPSRDVGSN